MKIPILKEAFSWHLVLRYLLGLIKILGIQFIMPADIYDYQLKQLSGVTLTWAFLGFSPWFSILLGFFEFIPATLSLFTRTKILGAILLFPLLLAVFLINNAYGFLPYMRVFSGVLLLINLLLLLPYYKLFIQFYRETLNQTSLGLSEIIIDLIIIGLITFLIIYNFK